MGLPKRRLVFQPSIFRCYVSFREGTRSILFVQEAEADQSDDDEDTMLLKQKIKVLQRVSTNSMNLNTTAKSANKRNPKYTPPSKTNMIGWKINHE